MDGWLVVVVVDASPPILCTFHVPTREYVVFAKLFVFHHICGKAYRSSRCCIIRGSPSYRFKIYLRTLPVVLMMSLEEYNSSSQRRSQEALPIQKLPSMRFVSVVVVFATAIASGDFIYWRYYYSAND